MSSPFPSLSPSLLFPLVFLSYDYFAAVRGTKDPQMMHSTLQADDCKGCFAPVFFPWAFLSGASELGDVFSLLV